MKKDIQPQIYNDCAVTCACGNSFVTSSTKKTLSVEICSACHPFYTGQQKFVDTEGRIDKFAKKQKLSEEKKKETLAKKEEKKKVVKKEVKPFKANPSLKELLQTSKEEK
jgi:large subunit ribosomal protein L31